VQRFELGEFSRAAFQGRVKQYIQVDFVGLDMRHELENSCC